MVSPGIFDLRCHSTAFHPINACLQLFNILSDCMRNNVKLGAFYAASLLFKKFRLVQSEQKTHKS